MAQRSLALTYLPWIDGQPPIDPDHNVFVRVGRYIDLGKYLEPGWLEVVGPRGPTKKRFWPEAWAPAPADVFV
jgi:hypothetical protein